MPEQGGVVGETPTQVAFAIKTDNSLGEGLMGCY